MKKFQSPADFYAGFNNDAILWSNLVEYARKDSIDLSGLNSEDRAQVEIRVKALLARMLWRSQGYFYVMNQIDPVLKKAMELLESNSPMPSAVKSH